MRSQSWKMQVIEKGLNSLFVFLLFLYIPFSFLKMQFFILTLLAIRSGISSYFWWFDMISARLRHNNYIMEILRDISWDLRFQLMSSTYIKSITNIIICSKNNLRSHNRLILKYSTKYFWFLPCCRTLCIILPSPNSKRPYATK